MKALATQTPIWGLMAEFAGPSEVVAAAHRVREEGYRKIDAYTPYPIEELSDALGHHHSWLPLLVLLGGIAGLVLGYGLEYWAANIAYPVNVGGRPMHSWPAFIVPAFETTILFAAGTAVLGMLALNGLPQPYHPVFNVAQFARASRDRFFVVVEATDPKFDLERTWSFLASLEPESLAEVEH